MFEGKQDCGQGRASRVKKRALGACQLNGTRNREDGMLCDAIECGVCRAKSGPLIS